MIESKSGKDGPGKERTPKWTRNPVEPGSSHKGFLAGHPFGAWVHFYKTGSQPCVRETTNGELFCQDCHVGKVPEWKGYTPYYSDQYVPMFVQISYEFEEFVKEIPLLSPIIITRGKADTDPIVITEKAWRLTPIPHSADRAKKPDMARFLLYTLWNCKALQEWVKKPHYVAPEPPTQKPEDSFSDDPSLAKLRRLRDAETKAKEEAASAELSIGETMNRITTPKPNGVYKKPR